jgi:hypothetical protein
MKSLTLLARFLGCYDTTWQQLRKRHNLKWTTGDESLVAMQRFFDDKLTLDSISRFEAKRNKVRKQFERFKRRYSILFDELERQLLLEGGGV